MKHETILQSLAKIEYTIYKLPYDQLSDYLKGVRDMINMLNGEENPSEILDHVLEQMAKQQLEIEIMDRTSHCETLLLADNYPE